MAIEPVNRADSEKKGQSGARAATVPDNAYLRLGFVLAIYAVFGILWVHFTDSALAALTDDPATLTYVQRFKGEAFIVLSAVLLYISLKAVIDRFQNLGDASTEMSLRHDQLMDALPDPVFSLDANGRIEATNIAAERTLGKSRSELKGLSPVEMVPEDTKPAVARSISRALAGMDQKIECKVYTPGGIRTFQVHAKPSRDMNRNVEHVLAIARDVTDQIRSELENRSRFHGFQKAMAQTVASISAIHEFRDAYTHGHQNRVAEIACRISDELGLPRFDRDSLELAGHVHDIGKMVVPIEFLTKPTPLTESEMGVIRSHAQIGYDVLSRIDFPWPISRLTYEHHERLDGSGYPNGLVASDLNLGSRILAVADVIDAMTSHRPYRLAADISVALEELVRNGGRLYDREVVAVCLDLYGKNDSSLARPAPGIPETNREKYGATSG